jgi:hypothetical protein
MSANLRKIAAKGTAAILPIDPPRLYPFFIVLPVGDQSGPWTSRIGANNKRNNKRTKKSFLKERAGWPPDGAVSFCIRWEVGWMSK